MSKKKEQPQIDKLTPAQEARIPFYLEKYIQIGLSTERCDRAKAEDAIRRSYKYLNLPDIQQFFWFENPFDAATHAAKLANGTETPTRAQVQDQASKASYGSFEAYWVSFYDFVANELPVEKDELIDIVKDIVQHCGVYWTFEGHVVISEKPAAIHMRDKKLHNVSGMALQYPDGKGIYAIDGTPYNSLMEVAMESALGNKAKEA